jgi:hypothetical protein
MEPIKNALSGKKTYFAVAIGILYLAGVWLGFWPFDEKILAAFGLSGLAFLRSAVAKGDVNKVLSVLFVCGLALGLAGCGALGTNPSAPSGVERTIFDVQTNYITVVQTNQVTQTNFVTVPVVVTNVLGVVQTNQVTQTNVLTSVVVVTNVAPAYTLAVPAAVKADVQAGGSILSTFMPGIGGMVSSGVLALLALWAYLRSSKLGNTSTALAQEIETLRQFIMSLPQGANYDQAITAWLQGHQVEAGVASEVLRLLQAEVSNPEAQVAAKELGAAIAVMSKQ